MALHVDCFFFCPSGFFFFLVLSVFSYGFECFFCGIVCFCGFIAKNIFVCFYHCVFYSSISLFLLIPFSEQQLVTKLYMVVMV